jgi:hypothetical protein
MNTAGRIQTDKVQRSMLRCGTFTRSDKNRIPKELFGFDRLIDFFKRLPNNPSHSYGQMSRLTGTLLACWQTYGIPRGLHQDIRRLLLKGCKKRHFRQRSGIARPRRRDPKAIDDHETQFFHIRTLSVLPVLLQYVPFPWTSTDFPTGVTPQLSYGR